MPFMLPQGNGVETVDPKLLKALLPPDPAGLNRSHQESQKTAMGGFRISIASARYSDGQTRNVNLSIMDCGGTSAFGMLAAWSMIEQDKETDDGYEKMGKVQGRPTHERWNRRTMKGEYGVLVGGRFLIEAHGTQADMETLKQVVLAIEFAKLEALKDFGMPAPASSPAP
jgi:hypothetical protein